MKCAVELDLAKFEVLEEKLFKGKLNFFYLTDSENGFNMAEENWSVNMADVNKREFLGDKDTDKFLQDNNFQIIYNLFDLFKRKVLLIASDLVTHDS